MLCNSGVCLLIIKGSSYSIVDETLEQLLTLVVRHRSVFCAGYLHTSVLVWSLSPRIRLRARVEWLLNLECHKPTISFFLCQLFSLH